MTNQSLPPLAQLLADLRHESGLSLRQVEKASGYAVSNVYLSQLELGRRSDPKPKFLVALAGVYKVPVKRLFEAAGYVDSPSATAVDVAFEQVLADPQFQFGTRFKESDLDQPSKRTIVDLYERATGKKLLLDAAD